MSEVHQCLTSGFFNKVVKSSIAVAKMKKTDVVQSVKETVYKKIKDELGSFMNKREDKSQLLDNIIESCEKFKVNMEKGDLESFLFPQAIPEAAEEKVKIPDIKNSVMFSNRDYNEDLRIMYGAQISARLKMESAFAMNAAQSFFVDRGGLPVNPVNIPMNIYRKKLELARSILRNMAGAKSYYTDSNGERWTVKKLRDKIDRGLEAVDEGMRLGKPIASIRVGLPTIDMEAIYHIFKQEIAQNVDNGTLDRWATSTSLRDMRNLDIYNSIFILRNFDGLIKAKFPDIINIGESAYNSDYIYYKDYSIDFDSNKLVKSWADSNDDIPAFKNAGGIVRAFIESIPYYKYGTNERYGTLNWNRFNAGIGMLKNLIYTDAANAYITMMQTYGDGTVSSKTVRLKDLINGISENSEYGLYDCLNFLFNGTVQDQNNRINAAVWVFDKLGLKQAESMALKNSIWSIWQGMYNDPDMYMLNNVSAFCRNNMAYHNYHLDMNQYIRSLNRIDFDYLSMDFDGSGVKRKSLNNRALDLALNKMTNTINGSSESIMNELDTYCGYMDARMGDNYQDAEFSISEYTNPEDASEKFLLFKNVPLGNSLYDVVVNPSSDMFMVPGNDEAVKYYKKTEVNKANDQKNAPIGQQLSPEELMVELGDIFSLDSTTTDKILSMAFRIDVGHNEQIKDVLYGRDEKSLSGRNERKIRLLNAAFGIYTCSWYDNNVFSKLSLPKKEFQSRINDVFGTTANGTTNNVLPARYRKGISMMHVGYMETLKSYLLEAMAYSQNMLQRDTVKMTNGNSTAVTQATRLLSNMGVQLKMVEDYETGNNDKSPVASLPIMNSVAGFAESLEGKVDKMVITAMKNIQGDVYGNTSVLRMASINGQDKNRSKFTPAESFITDFVVNYLNCMYGDDKFIPLNAEINSDKGYVTYANINRLFVQQLHNLPWDTFCKIVDASLGGYYKKVMENVKDDISRLEKFINGQFTAIYEATNGGNISRSEFESVLDNDSMGWNDIESLFYLYNEFRQSLHVGIDGLTHGGIMLHGDNLTDGKIDGSINYDAFNALFGKAVQKDVNAYNAMFTIAKLYNSKNPIDRIQLVDQTHFINDGGGIAANPLLKGFYKSYNGYSKKSDPMTFAGFNELMSIKSRQMFYTMLDNDIELIMEKNGKETGLSNLTKYMHDFSKDAWKYDGRMILGKIRRRYINEEGKELTAIYNITNVDTMKDALRRMTGQLDVDPYLKTYSAYMDIMSRLGCSVELNPDISKFNAVNTFLGESYTITGVGDNFNHPVKKWDKINSLLEYAAKATYAQIKRNVQFTTTVHLLNTDTLSGPRSEAIVAPIEDMSNTVSSFSGVRTNIKPHDGGGWSSLTYTRAFQDAMGNSRVGNDTKPFFHALNPRTGTGEIIKASIDGLTNKVLRHGKNLKILAKKTMDARWNINGRNTYGNIFTDYGIRFNADGTRANLFDYVNNKYGGFYVQTGNGKFEKITNIEYSGAESFDANTDEVVYKISTVRVDTKGNELPVKTEPREVSITSNYDLWNALGGEWSMQLDGNTGTLIPSENSVAAVVDIMNNTGVKVDAENGGYNNLTIEDMSEDLTQREVYQFMKHDNIDIVATHGAMKQGYTNVNRYQDAYFNRKGKLNSMTFRMYNSGVVLDPTHKAENSKISELTQVVNALSNMGYTKEFSNAVYDALALLTTSDVEALVKQIDPDATLENPPYADLAATLVVRSMAESKSFSDEERSLCKNLIFRVESGHPITYKDLRKCLDTTSSSFILQGIPVIASHINKHSIQKKNPGILALMKPSTGLVQMFGGRMWGDTGVTDKEKYDYLSSLQSDSPDIKQTGDLRMGHIYRAYMKDDASIDALSNIEKIRSLEKEGLNLVTIDGNTIYFNLKDYNVYKALKDVMRSGMASEIKEAYIRPVRSLENGMEADEADITLDTGEKFVALGRELAPIDYHLTFNSSSTGPVDINLYDLSIVDMMFRMRNGEDVTNELRQLAKYTLGLSDSLSDTGGLEYYDYLLAKGYQPMDIARMVYQQQLGELSRSMRGRGSGRVWYRAIDNKGNELNIPGEATSVSVRYYEAVQPCIYRDRFGMTPNDKLQDITPEFFARKMAQAYVTRIEPGKYSYMLLKNNGRHIYIWDRKRMGGNPDMSGLTPVSFQIESDSETGDIYRLDSKDNRMYKLYEEDAIYKTKDGTEIIITEDPATVIGSLGFAGLKISNSLYNKFDGDKEKLREHMVYLMETAADEDGSDSAKYYSYVKKGKNGVILKSNMDLAVDSAIEEDAAIKAGSDMSSMSNPIYNAIMEKINSGNFDSLNAAPSNACEKSVWRNSMQMYDSFKETLHTLVARTPSQTMQSFMPMVTVAFEDSGNNACYVSDMQVWLQGSDFDGDKTNFQQYDINNRGVLEGWSPYFNVLEMDTSMNLPFPNGNRLDPKKDIYITEDDLKSDEEDMDFYYFKEYVNQVVREDYESGKIFIDSDDTSAINGILQIAAKYPGKVFQVSDDVDVMNAVIDLINTHNTYFSKLDNKRMGGVKNFILKNSLRVIEDPRNLYEAQSSVDDMDYISKLGDKDEKSKERLGMAYADVILKYDALANNIIGKDTISVVASGMKTVFNVMNFLNSREFKDTEGANPETRLSLLTSNYRFRSANGTSPVIAGRQLNFLANWNPSDQVKERLNEVLGALKQEQGIEWANTQNSNELVKAIVEMLNGENMNRNAGLVLSALMTEATDNAKNLNLAKINASMEMAPLYIFGIAAGLDLQVLGKIMMSDTAREVSKLMQGNIFYGEKQSNVISNLVKWNEKGVMTKARLGKVLNNIISYYDGQKTVIRDNLKEFANIALLAKNKFYVMRSPEDKYGFNSYEEMIRTIDKGINEAVSYAGNVEGDKTAYNSVMTAVYNLQEAKRKASILNSMAKETLSSTGLVPAGTLYANDPVLNSLNQLDKGRNEFAFIAQLVGLNKGVKTTRDDQIAFLGRLRDCLISEDDKVNKENAKYLRQFAIARNPWMDDSKPVFNPEEFVRNAQYRKAAIEVYDKTKRFAINPLELLWELPLIRSYFRISNIANNLSVGLSQKNQVIEWISEYASSKMGAFLSNKERRSIAGNSAAYVEQRMLNAFFDEMRNEDGKPFVSFSVASGDSGVEMEIGTKEGNKAFLKWMNERVIPRVKNGIYGDTKADEDNQSVSRNFFMGNLNMSFVDRTLTMSSFSMYTPSVDPRSSDRSDIDFITKLTAEAQKMNGIYYKDVNGKSHNIGNLLWIYNMLIMNGQGNINSLERYIGADSPVAKRYSEYANRIMGSIAGGDMLTLNRLFNFSTNDASIGDLKWLAPVSNPNTSHSEYVRFYNRQYMEWQILRKVKEENSGDSRNEDNEDSDELNSEYYADDYGYDYDMDENGGDGDGSPSNWIGYDESKYKLDTNQGDKYDVTLPSSITDWAQQARMENRTHWNMLENNQSGMNYDFINNRSAEDRTLLYNSAVNLFNVIDEQMRNSSSLSIETADENGLARKIISDVVRISPVKKTAVWTPLNGGRTLMLNTDGNSLYFYTEGLGGNYGFVMQYDETTGTYTAKSVKFDESSGLTKSEVAVYRNMVKSCNFKGVVSELKNLVEHNECE